MGEGIWLQSCGLIGTVWHGTTTPSTRHDTARYGTIQRAMQIAKAIALRESAEHGVTWRFLNNTAVL